MVPAVVHGRYDQPLVAIGLQHQAHQFLYRPCGVDRRHTAASRVAGVKRFDALGAVLQQRAFGRSHDGNDGRSDVRHDDLPVHLGVREHFFKVQTGPAQVRAHLAGEVAQFGAVEQVWRGAACHGDVGWGGGTGLLCRTKNHRLGFPTCLERA